QKKKKKKKSPGPMGKKKPATKMEKKMEKFSSNFWGRRSLEAVIFHFQTREAAKTQRKHCAPHSPVLNMSLSAHSEKDERILYGFWGPALGTQNQGASQSSGGGGLLDQSGYQTVAWKSQQTLLWRLPQEYKQLYLG
uniref:Uncharacterized protein n=1 Tax=Catagonus wagneri TaxID=51154 RepID=A0A8C3WW93_9CETA